MTAATPDRIETEAAPAAAPAAQPPATRPAASPLVFATYAAASLLLGLTQGLGLNLVAVNLTG
ncbi:hypothetical protein, partial [Klebsiella aerogenes]|uniref:hypothetical protein n=1 Tax=Klebsiella aerogenes TaxID=548 RepID=UPI00195452A7